MFTGADVERCVKVNAQADAQFQGLPPLDVAMPEISTGHLHTSLCWQPTRSDTMEKTIGTLIRVGHSSYRGANAMRFCFSKAQAVRVLRNRGVKRDDARSAVAKAMKEQGATVYGEHNQVVEIVNEDYSFRAGYFVHSYSDLRRKWAAVSEL